VFVEVNKDLIISEDHKRATTAPATPAEPTTPATANAPPAPKPTVKVLLSNDDPLFCKLRDMNFACVGSALHEHAKSVSETLKVRAYSLPARRSSEVAHLMIARLRSSNRSESTRPRCRTCGDLSPNFPP